jgi:hypothetical protein
MHISARTVGNTALQHHKDADEENAEEIMGPKRENKRMETIP